MIDFCTKDRLSPAKSGQLTRRGAMPLGLLALLSMAACTSSGDSPATETPPTPSESVTFVESAVTDSLFYIIPESLDGVDLEQFDKSSFVLEGSDGATPINLGDLDSSEVSIVTNSEGNQVFAVARSAVNKHASSNSTSSAPISYNLKATSAISFIDRQGKSQTIDVGDVITEDALTIDPALVSVIKELADVQGNTAQLAAITVDLGEVFTSVSAISFSAVDDEGNAIALTDKNRDGIAAEFSLDELAASFGESGTITVRAETAGGIFVGQSFSVVVMQHEVNTPFVGDGEVVTITNGNAKIASILALPLSGGDGEITYALEGNNKDLAGLSFVQGELFFSADASGTYTLVATDADGDRATVSIDCTISEVSIANALAAQTHEGNDGAIEVNLAEVFAGDGDLTLTTDHGEITNNILTIDTSALADGDHAIRVTAKDSDGEMAIDTFVLTVDKSPTIVTALADGAIDGNGGTIIDLASVFGDGSGMLTLAASAGTMGSDNRLTLVGSDLADGVNTLIITATDADGDAVEETVVVTSDKSPTIAVAISDEFRTTNHSNTTLDLTTFFADGSGTLNYAVTASNGGEGISVANSALTIDYVALGVGTHSITVTATDNDAQDADQITDVFVVKVFDSHSTLNDRSLGSKAFLRGTTLDDVIIGNSFEETGLVTRVDLDGNAGNDVISSNTFTARILYTVTFDGGDGNDTISNNTLNASDRIDNVTFYGGDGNDTITHNALKALGGIHRITFDGGDGNDTISNNILNAKHDDGYWGDDVFSLTFDGGAGDDIISDNTFIAKWRLYSLTLAGNDGDDTISNNTFTAGGYVSNITLDGGAGDDTISDNHFEATRTASDDRIYSVTLMGGAGNDVFRHNIVSQTNSNLARLNIDGGDGEDTVVFRSIADAYTGITDWIDGGVTTITLIGDGAIVTLIDVETISFADGVSFQAANAWVLDNNTAFYDLARAFEDADTFTAYSTDSSATIGADNTMTLAGTELAHGANTIVVTATATDNTETTETITINALKTLKIAGAKQYDEQTLDLDAIFVDAHTYSYTSTTPNGISLNNGILSFDNTVLSEGTQFITITATDGRDASNVVVGTHTLTYSLDTIKDQRGDFSNTTYAGTTLADAINDNVFASQYNLFNVYLNGSAGDDSISNNTITAWDNLYSITFHGGAGDDTISDNHFESNRYYGDVYAIALKGGAGDDLFRDNVADNGRPGSATLTIDGGEGEDTVVFRLGVDKYRGITSWIDGVTTITLSGDAAAVTLIDVETISFADGASYSATDTWVRGNGGFLYDLANVFRDTDATFTTYATDSGTITSDNALALAGSELINGANTIVVTATADDNTKTTETITVNAVKTLKSLGVKQHDLQTIDLNSIFVDEHTYIYTYTYTGTQPNGISLNNSIISFHNDVLSVGTSYFTITATDGSDAFAHTLTYSLDTIKDRSGDGSYTSYANSTFADAITQNTIAATSGDLKKVNLAGGAGDDTISDNSLTADEGVHSITFHGGAGNDTISDNHLETGWPVVYVYPANYGSALPSSNSFWSWNNEYSLFAVTFLGGEGDDTINDNYLRAPDFLSSVTFDGGVGDDTINGNTFSGGSVTSITLDGGEGDDTISGNTFSGASVTSITLDGGVGNNTISGNTFSGASVTSIILDGGDGNNTISDNVLESTGSTNWDSRLSGGNLYAVTFIAEAGNDSISNNSLTATIDLYSITLDTGDGDDTLSNNTLTARDDLYSITFDGGAGDDTISNNTLTAPRLSGLTFDGGAGDDTISDNHFEASGMPLGDDLYGIEVHMLQVNFPTLVLVSEDYDSPNNRWLHEGYDFAYTGLVLGGDDDDYDLTTESQYYNNIYSVNLIGGAGDDVFRNNTASIANGRLASLTIHGGDGEDTVVFRSLADEYTGIDDWLDISDGGITTITLSGDGAAVTLIDVETIAFADGESFQAADAWALDNNDALYDLADAFGDTFTAYSTRSGTIGTDKTLTIASTDLAHGANTFVLTATADDSSETTETITVNAIKTLKSTGAKQHDQQTIDLKSIFSDGYAYTSTLPSGVGLHDSTLSFNNSLLTEGEHFITITATDSIDVLTHTLTYALDAIKDQTLGEGGSNTTYTGNALADAITNNSFGTSDSLTNVDLDGGAGNDTISNNTLTARDNNVKTITFDGGDGNDTISNNSINAGSAYSITFDGGTGDDIISNNNIVTLRNNIWGNNFEGGDGDDTLIGNTLIANSFAHAIKIPNGTYSNIVVGRGNTFDGGDGDDTISDNHFESTGTGSGSVVQSVVLRGGAGDDVFRNNSAAQANGELASLTIHGGDGNDTVVFRSIADAYTGITDWIDFSDGAVTTITLVGDRAAVTLIDVETISFANGVSYSAANAWVEGHGGISYDLANVFPGAFAGEDTTFTNYSTDRGTIGTDNTNKTTLALAGTELAHGANTIVVTAIANNNTETTETITINVVRNLEILQGATQHNEQTFDLADIFVETASYSARELPSGVTLDNGNLTFANTALGAGDHALTITATDGGDAFIHTLIYALETIKDQGGDESYTTYSGTALADAITGNAFASKFFALVGVDLVGDAGDDNISDNTFTASDRILNINLDGGDGDDIISGNILTSSGSIWRITFDGGDDNDTINNNTFNASGGIWATTFDGGAGNDTISGNTLSALNSAGNIAFVGGIGVDTLTVNTITADHDVNSITFDGGAGNDTIRDNTLISSSRNVQFITFIGGDGNDTISGNALMGGSEDYDDVHHIILNGGDGDDAISDNTLSAGRVYSVIFEGREGNDTISGNTLTASRNAYSKYAKHGVQRITFDGGDGDDTISDNHFESSGADHGSDVISVTLMGGAGDDVFRDNTASQANGALSRITIDGGVGTDAVHFELASGMFTITGTYGSNITVTDNAKRTGEVDSHAEYVLLDIEELYFGGSATPYDFDG